MDAIVAKNMSKYTGKALTKMKLKTQENKLLSGAAMKLAVEQNADYIFGTTSC